MKVSKEQKEKTRRKLVQAGVELISAVGYKDATMKKIAQAAGVGDATIYKYFPTKEHILLEFYEVKSIDTIQEVNQIESFEEYELQEKLQVLLETYLEALTPDRPFVEESLKMIFQSPLFLFNDLAPIKKEFVQVSQVMLSDAVEKGEIPDFPFANLVPSLFVEYVIGVLFYWLRDESNEYSNTTQLIDLSLNLIVTILKSGILSKVTNLAGFLFRSQLFGAMESGFGVFEQLIQARKEGMGKEDQ